MKPIIELIANGEKSNKIELYSGRSSFKSRDVVDVVYQDSKYEYYLYDFEALSDLMNVSLIVNNRIINTQFKLVNESTINLIPIKDDFPFSMVFGLTDIAVHFEYKNFSEKYLFSSLLAVAVNKKYKASSNSVNSMLDEIYKRDYSLLHKGKARNSQKHPKYLRKESNKYEEELVLLQAAVSVLRKNLPYFVQMPRTKVETAFVVDSFDKLRTVNARNLEYIATHPEFLRESTNSKGIYINKHKMIPEKTLVKTHKFSTNIIENRLVLSFIHTLICYANKKIQGLEKALEENSISVVLNEVVDENYFLSNAIIFKYTQITCIEHLKNMNDISNKLKELFVNYKKTLICDYALLHSVPAPTAIFLEVYHYRNIYEMINKWFSYGEFFIPKNSTMIHFSNADKIYEYYCLLEIYEIFVSLGLQEDKNKRCLYEYIVPKYSYDNEVENTFYFKCEDIEITLYYQPIIYSDNSQTTNDIGLFRVDKNFYSPDFIIKKKSSDGIKYGIIDSKWRNQSVLLDKFTSGGFVELVYKYIYSIVDEKDLKSVSFMWLLQGKDDYKTKPIYSHNNGKISRSKSSSFQNSSGIVRLTPKSGNIELKKIIRSFIFEK